MDTQWLLDLRPGDKVILHTSYDKEVATVDRVTRTQIVVKRNSHDWKFRKSDGREVGGFTYHSSHIKPFDSEVVIQIQLEKSRKRVLHALHEVTRTAVDTLTLVQCCEVLVVLDKYGLTSKKQEA